MTNGPGKSDRPVVPEKSPNNSGQPVAEEMEGSGLAKGNLPQQNVSRTPCRTDTPSALERVRQAAGKDKKLRFTALLHHIYNLDTLRMAYFSLKKEAAPGVDGETWRHYGEQLERNLQDLSERLKRGAYRAKPVRRVFIPKADGRQRPLGVTALEDKNGSHHLHGQINLAQCAGRYKTTKAVHAAVGDIQEPSVAPDVQRTVKPCFGYGALRSAEEFWPAIVTT